jgi:hypothetical protein
MIRMARTADNGAHRRVTIIGSNTELAGEKVVAAAATPEALAADVACRRVCIQAKTTNTQSIFVGNAAGQYLELAPGASVERYPSNLNLIYIKVQVNGEGVNYGGEA